jgi:transcriptional regulator GlxA family with amidase domain
MTTYGILLFDSAQELDFTGSWEVFPTSSGLRDGRDDVLLVAERSAPVKAAYGSRLCVDHGWAPEEADLLVVPGGGYARREDPGVWAEIRRGSLPRALAAATRPGLTVSALCTGVMLLSSAGMTTGRPCTTHHQMMLEYEARGTVWTARGSR